MTLPPSPAMSPMPEGLSFYFRPVLTRVLQSLSCPVIVERLPELLKFSKEEKWQLVVELQDELLADDPTEEEPLKSDIVAALDRRMRHYREHPESAVTLDQLTEKIRRLKK